MPENKRLNNPALAIHASVADDDIFYMVKDPSATAVQGSTAGLVIKDYVAASIATGTYQPLDDTLTALAAYNTNGLLTQTAADTFIGRTITGTTSRLSVTNGDGVSGNPTLDIDAAYVGQASITTLGTITTGTWNGTDIGIAYGGTGVSVDINTGGTLSNVAYLDQANTFTQNQRVDAKIGIGTDPTSSLHIVAVSQHFKLERSGVGAWDQNVINLSTKYLEFACATAVAQGYRYKVRDSGGTAQEAMMIDSNSRVTIGTDAYTGASAQLSVSQSSATAAIPVLKLKQTDISEEMMELDGTTIGTGNAIEAVGAKTLTTTHFVKVTITGVGTRYFPVGTIA